MKVLKELPDVLFIRRILIKSYYDITELFLAFLQVMSDFINLNFALEQQLIGLVILHKMIHDKWEFLNHFGG